MKRIMVAMTVVAMSSWRVHFRTRPRCFTTKKSRLLISCKSAAFFLILQPVSLNRDFVTFDFVTLRWFKSNRRLLELYNIIILYN